MSLDIMVDELKQRLDANEDIFRIDVREPYENEEFNIGGELIPLGSLPSKISELTASKDAEIIVYCRSGGRSGMAKQILEQEGFNNVRNLVGGMLEWQRVHG